jgi:hypothetical protein
MLLLSSWPRAARDISADLSETARPERARRVRSGSEPHKPRKTTHIEAFVVSLEKARQRGFRLGPQAIEDVPPELGDLGGLHRVA